MTLWLFVHTIYNQSQPAYLQNLLHILFIYCRITMIFLIVPKFCPYITDFSGIIGHRSQWSQYACQSAPTVILSMAVQLHPNDASHIIFGSIDIKITSMSMVGIATLELHSLKCNIVVGCVCIIMYVLTPYALINLYVLYIHQSVGRSSVG